MMDIGDFLKNAGGALLTKGSSAALAGLGGLVVYEVKGNLRSGANGLSCYYSYDSDQDALRQFEDVSDCAGFKYFYEYTLNSNLSEAGKAYVQAAQAAAGAQAAQVQPLTPVSGLDGLPLKQQNGRYALDVGARAKSLACVYLHVLYYSIYDGHIDSITDLGTSHDVDFSRQNDGVFTDTFNGKWAVAHDAGYEAYSNPIYLTAADRKPGKYTIYTTPVMIGGDGNLPGEDYLLYLHYDETNGSYKILGAKKAIDAKTGMADKELRQLGPDDAVIPIPRMSWRQQDGTFTPLDFSRPTHDDLEYGGAFMLSDSAEFYDRIFLDGYYRVSFEMVDYAGNSYESAAGWYKFDENGNSSAIPASQAPSF